MSYVCDRSAIVVVLILVLVPLIYLKSTSFNLPPPKPVCEDSFVVLYTASTTRDTDIDDFPLFKTCILHSKHTRRFFLKDGCNYDVLHLYTLTEGGLGRDEMCTVEKLWRSRCDTLETV